MRWVSVFSRYQEVKSSALVLFLFYVPGIYYVLKKVVMSFFCTFLFLSDYQSVVDSLLQAVFCHNPFRIRKLEQPKNNTI